MKVICPSFKSNFNFRWNLKRKQKFKIQHQFQHSMTCWNDMMHTLFNMYSLKNNTFCGAQMPNLLNWNVVYDCCPQMKPMSTNPRNVKVIGYRTIVSSSYRWPICHVRSRELNFCDSWPWNATRNGSLGTATHLLHLDESSSLLLVGHVQHVRG